MTKKLVDRTPPFSNEAEMGTLGSMLVSPKDAISECVEKIHEGYFHIPAHRTIYKELVGLWQEGQAVDPITFTQVLRDKKLLDVVGGVGFVTSLFTFVPTAANLNYYLEILKDKYVLRQIISTCTEGVKRSYEEQDNVDLLLDEVEAKILAITPEKAENKTIQDYTHEAIEHIEKLYASKGEIVGLKTGLSDLDKKLRGLKPGELVVIGGPTGMGKTSLAMNIAEHIALKDGLGVGILSLEMTGDELTHRLIQSHSRLNIEAEAQRSTREQSIPKLMKSSELIMKAPIYLRDDSDMSGLQARGIVRKMHHDYKISLLIADYAQLFLPDGKRDDTKATELSELAKSFKRMAKELKIVVILLSQLNDGGQLFDSRAIGHHADKIFILRPDGDTTWLEIKKNRNGERGSVALTFLSHITRFENAARVNTI